MQKMYDTYLACSLIVWLLKYTHLGVGKVPQLMFGLTLNILAAGLPFENLDNNCDSFIKFVAKLVEPCR